MRKLSVLAGLTFFVVGQPQAQTTKGAKPVEMVQPATATGVTRALVVGISDYQHLPDLGYADKDATAFAAFLQSPGGGGLNADQLTVLLNEQATACQVVMALYRLIDDSRENDRAIIYFSGHGDVESRLANASGYLLCWDTQPSCYSCGGGIPMELLERVVQTLAIENKCKVWLTIDACRAGKLAGSVLSGPGIALGGLFRLLNDAVIILSCQPSELSHEGVRWGGGRGVFSYHLLDALSGLADTDKNELITLKEVGAYLESKIPLEAAPHKQNPVLIGDKETVLCSVNPELLKNLNDIKVRRP